MLRFVLTRRHARISLPVSQRGLEMPDRGRLLFGVSVAVEQREVARRENLFGVVFAEIRHRVGIISPAERQFAGRLALKSQRSGPLISVPIRDGGNPSP